MNRYIQTGLIPIVVGMLLLLTTCKDEETVANPCDEYRQPLPSFWIRDDLQQECNNELGINWACDTLIRMGEYTFSSALDYGTYHWEILGDPSFKRSTKSFKFIPTDAMIIQVRLVGKRNPNALCNPFDDGVDTVVKTITVLPSIDTLSLIYGKYIGYDEANPSREVGFEVVYERPPGYVNYMMVIKHFPDSCPDQLLLAAGSKVSYNLLFMNNQNNYGCQSPEGWFLLTPSGVDIQYETNDLAVSGSKPVKRRFIGRRVR